MNRTSAAPMRTQAVSPALICIAFSADRCIGGVAQSLHRVYERLLRNQRAVVAFPHCPFRASRSSLDGQRQPAYAADNVRTELFSCTLPRHGRGMPPIVVFCA